MNADEKEKLKNLLGEEFSSEEIDEILKKDPKLGASAERISVLFKQIRMEKTPALSPDFTVRLMEHIEAPSLWQRLGQSLFSFRALATAAACAASFIVGLWLAPQYLWGPKPEPLSVREAIDAQGQPVYYVRFTAKSPGAHTIAVAGDFNQWNPLPLMQVNAQEGVFSAEVPLRPGTYGYSFVVDDKKWVVDASAPHFVEDGFGNKNSVINL